MPELKEKRNIVLYIWLIKYWMHLPKRQIDYSYFFGRLSYEKGVKTLISAFKDMPNSNLKIAGTGRWKMN